MAIVINGTGTVTGITGITGTNATVTGITSVASNSASTPVVLQDSGSNTNTCRAWVNFNGTGTVAIRASFNVSSITDNGTGDYTVNFTTSMPDVNYSVVATCTQRGGSSSTANRSIGFGNSSSNLTDGTYSTTAVQLYAQGSSTGGFDAPTVSVAVFR